MLGAVVYVMLAVTQGLNLHTIGEFQIPFRDLEVESLSALSPMHSFYAPGGGMRRDGAMVLMENQKLWFVSPTEGARVIATDPSFASVSWEDDGTLVLVGGKGVRRIRVVDSTGARLREFLLDFSMVGAQARLYGDSLLIAGGQFYVREGKKDRLYGLAVYNLKTGALLRRFFETTGAELELVNTKSNSAVFGVSFDITATGTILACRSSDYRMYEYSVDGSLLRVIGNGPTPQYYIPLSRVRPLDLRDPALFQDLEGTALQGRMRQVLDGWLGQWSPTCFPLVYSQDYAIVQRGFVPPYDVEVFSLQDGRLVGHARTSKRFFYCEREGGLVFFLDVAGDSALLLTSCRLDLGLTGPSIEAPVTEYAGPTNTYPQVESLLAPDLGRGRENVVLCTTPFDCGFPEYFAACSSYTVRNNWRLLVAVSYEVRDALGSYVSRLRGTLGTDVVARPSYVRALSQGRVISATPAVLVFDGDGKLVGETDMLQQMPLDSFLLGIQRKISARAERLPSDTLVARYFYIVGGGPCENTKQALLRLALEHPVLDVRLAPICVPENYMMLRDLEKSLSGGTAHALPVLVVRGNVLSGSEILPQLTKMLAK